MFTLPLRSSCCMSWSGEPIPIKAQIWAACSEEERATGSFGSAPAWPAACCWLSMSCSRLRRQPSPRRYMHGGGQKNRFSLPYDFWATLAWRIITTMSPLSFRYFRMASLVSLCSFICLQKWPMNARIINIPANISTKRRSYSTFPYVITWEPLSTSMVPHLSQFINITKGLSLVSYPHKFIVWQWQIIPRKSCTWLWFLASVLKINTISRINLIFRTFLLHLYLILSFKGCVSNKCNLKGSSTSEWWNKVNWIPRSLTILRTRIFMYW